MRKAWLAGCVGGVMACAAAGCREPRPVAAPVEEDVFHMARPELKWQHQGGRRYNLTLTEPGKFRVQGGIRVPEIVASKQNYEHGTYRPDFDLRWNRSYLLQVSTVSDEGGKLELAIPFRVAYEVTRLRNPENQSAIASIEPFFDWHRAQQPGCRYQFQLAEREDFSETLANDENAGTENHILGPDRQPGTADDLYQVWHQPKVVLKPQGTYYWRVRTVYVDRNGTELGRGEWANTHIFTVARQPDLGGELLESLTQVTNSPDKEINATVSVNDDIAFQLTRTVAGSIAISEIVMVRAKKDAEGQVVYERGVQQVTQSVSNTLDGRPRWDEKGEGVFFHSNRADNQFNVWYRNLSRRGLEQSTQARHGAFSPVCSPDGSRVAYAARDEQGESSIWIMNRDGSKPTQVVSGEQPCWSPDGSRLAYVADDRITGAKHIWVMNVDGQQPTALTTNGSNQEPAWSPDGRFIAYASNRSQNWDIWLLDLEGNTDRKVTEYLGTDGAPAWSPDGRRLAFHTTRNTREFNIWIGLVKQ